MKLSQTMEVYRTPTGAVKHSELFAIPREQRIAALMSGPAPEKVAAQSAIATAISIITEGEGISDNMAFLITSNICRDAIQDQISIQDVIIFLQDMQAGLYGKFYGAPTVLQVMEKFEQYRDQRHVAMMNIREEEHAQLKSKELRYEPPASSREQIDQDKLNDQIKTLKNKYGEF